MGGLEGGGGSKNGGQDVVVGTSELLRGIPDFRNLDSSGGKNSASLKSGARGERKGRTGNVNPVPAGVLQRGSVPKNGHEFAREFKRAGKTPEEKIAWLAGSIPEEAYASIFRVELDAEILQALILTMHAALLGGGEAKTKKNVKKDEEEEGQGPQPPPSTEGGGLCEENGGDKEESKNTGRGFLAARACRRTLAALCLHCPKALDFAASFQTEKDKLRALEVLAQIEKKEAEEGTGSPVDSEKVSEDLRAIRKGFLLDD